MCWYIILSGTSKGTGGTKAKYNGIQKVFGILWLYKGK